MGNVVSVCCGTQRRSRRRKNSKDDDYSEPDSLGKASPIDPVNQTARSKKGLDPHLFYGSEGGGVVTSGAADQSPKFPDENPQKSHSSSSLPKYRTPESHKLGSLNSSSSSGSGRSLDKFSRSQSIIDPRTFEFIDALHLPQKSPSLDSSFPFTRRQAVSERSSSLKNDQKGKGEHLPTRGGHKDAQGQSINVFSSAEMEGDELADERLGGESPSMGNYEYEEREGENEGEQNNELGTALIKKVEDLPRKQKKNSFTGWFMKGLFSPKSSHRKAHGNEREDIDNYRNGSGKAGGDIDGLENHSTANTANMGFNASNSTTSRRSGRSSLVGGRSSIGTSSQNLPKSMNGPNVQLSGFPGVTTSQSRTDKKSSFSRESDQRSGGVGSRNLKILMSGAGESGKSTFVKQMKIIHEGGFSPEELQNYRNQIYRNIHESILQLIDLIEGTDLCASENSLRAVWTIRRFASATTNFYAFFDELEALPADYIEAVNYLWVEVLRSSFDSITESSRRIAIRDGKEAASKRSEKEAIKAASDSDPSAASGSVSNSTSPSKNTQMSVETFLERASSTLIDSAPYFFDEISRIGRKGYIPTNEDVLRARIITTGISEYSFKSGPLNITLIDVGGQRSERRKWIETFENITTLVFCVALSEYDMVLREETRQNRLLESFQLWETIINSKWFQRTSIVLFLNKKDIFRKKLRTKPLSDYFSDYREFQAEEMMHSTSLSPEVPSIFVEEEMERGEAGASTKSTQFSGPFDDNGKGGTLALTGVPGGKKERSGSAKGKLDEGLCLDRDFERAAEFIKNKFLAMNYGRLSIYPYLTCATDTENINMVFTAVKETIMANNLRHVGIL